MSKKSKIYQLIGLAFLILSACSSKQQPQDTTNVSGNQGLSTQAQGSEDFQVLNKLFEKKSSLGMTIRSFDNPHSEDEFDKLQETNQAIKTELKRLLSIPSIQEANLEKLLKNDRRWSIDCAEDKKFCGISWDKETGGTMHEYAGLFLGKSDDKHEVYFFEDADNIGNIDNVFLLKDETYLVVSSSIGCATCLSINAAGYKIANGKKIVSHPAFRQVKSKRLFVDDQGNSAGLTYREKTEDGPSFEFNPKTKRLTYAYQPDDITPIAYDEKKRSAKQLVKGQLQFEEGYFMEK